MKLITFSLVVFIAALFDKYHCLDEAVPNHHVNHRGHFHHHLEHHAEGHIAPTTLSHHTRPAYGLFSRFFGRHYINGHLFHQSQRHTNATFRIESKDDSNNNKPKNGDQPDPDSNGNEDGGNGGGKKRPVMTSTYAPVSEPREESAPDNEVPPESKELSEE